MRKGIKAKIASRKIRRVKRTRAKISGTDTRPRLAVFRSNKNLYLQLISDTKGKTVASACTLELKAKSNKVSQAEMLGELLAGRAKALGIESAVFDKRSYKYHGRVKAAAEALRKAGLSL